MEKNSETKIVYDAYHKYYMIYLDTVNINNKKVLLFKNSERSNLEAFMEKFHAKKVYASHTEDDLYGIIIQ